MVYGDGIYTWGFTNVYFDHTGEAQAFMVFDPVSLGVVDPASSLFPYDAFDPHSGRQVLACFQGVAVGSDGYGESAMNDDWFISGEVYDGQTISFWAKSGDYLQGIDKFEVLYSTTDRSTSSFKKLSGVIDTSEKWTEHTFQLPANTKYFAIHCVSEDGFVLYIDDLKYMERFTTTLVKHTGYRVYRDGKVIAELPANVESFTDAGLKSADYKYYVTAVYDNASESGASNVVELRIGEGGIDGVANDESEVTVTSESGVIVVNGATADATVAGVAADGKVLFEACGEESYRVNVATGVYLVRVADRKFKVAVK